MAEGCRITCSGSTKRRRRPWSSTSALHLSVSVLFAAQNAQAFFASWGLTSSSSLVSVASGGVHRAGHGSASGWKMPLRTERWSETRGHRELLSRETAQLLCTIVYPAIIHTAASAAAAVRRTGMVQIGVLRDMTSYAHPQSCCERATIRLRVVAFCVAPEGVFFVLLVKKCSNGDIPVRVHGGNLSYLVTAYS